MTGTDRQSSGIEDEALKQAQLAQLLRQRREGSFISVVEMDLRLMAMFERKRQEAGRR